MPYENPIRKQIALQYNEFAGRILGLIWNGNSALAVAYAHGAEMEELFVEPGDYLFSE